MKSRHSITDLFIFFFALTRTVHSAANSQCHVTLELSQCTSTNANSTSSNPESSEHCGNGSICDEQFTISQFGKSVYGVRMIEQLLQTCCGPCLKMKKMDTVSKISDLKKPAMESVDLVFPVLGRAEESRLHGYHFIPLIEAPRVYFVTHCEHHVLRDVISSCLTMWPLLCVTAMMVLISGFICWLLETWGNKEEFPRGFLIGWFEGVWWSFISMTTVGYGDKAPKSIAARIFSIIWIVIGIATFSLITAAITSVIVAINSSPPPTMEDANVAVLRNHLYDSILVANQGGVVVDVHSTNMTDGIHKMVDLLHNNKINGFLVDRFALVLFYTFFHNHTIYGHDVRYIKNYGILTDITSTSKSYMHGILLKHRQHYDFLYEFVRSNRDVIDSCNRLFLNAHSRSAQIKQEVDPLFSMAGEMFWPTMYSLSTVLLLILVTGMIYEVKMKNKSGKREKSKSKKEKSNGTDRVAKVNTSCAVRL